MALNPPLSHTYRRSVCDRMGFWDYEEPSDEDDDDQKQTPSAQPYHGENKRDSIASLRPILKLRALIGHYPLVALNNYSSAMDAFATEASVF